MITKNQFIDQIEVLADGQLQVREAIVISEDGQELGRSFHRYVLDPATDTTDQITDPRLLAVATAVWDDATVTARTEQVNALRAPTPLEAQSIGPSQDAGPASTPAAGGSSTS